MKTIKITAFRRDYEGKNNTDDPSEYSIYDWVEFSENLADKVWDFIGDWHYLEEIDHCIVEEKKNGIVKKTEEYEVNQLYLLFNN